MTCTNCGDGRRLNRKAFCYLMAPPLSASLQNGTSVCKPSSSSRTSALACKSPCATLTFGAGNSAQNKRVINDLGFDMYQRILAEAVKELKEEQFKDLMEAEQAESGEYVEETVLETDLSLLIPDHYVSDIPERISLYRELDNLNIASDLQGFRDRLEDRFGPLPVETAELLGTIRLRWVAQWLGIEKLVLKSGKLIAAFVSDEESAYFQSATFARVLEYLKHHAKDASMYQRNGGRLKIEKVDTVLQALAIFEDIAGMTADERPSLPAPNQSHSQARHRQRADLFSHQTGRQAFSNGSHAHMGTHSQMLRQTTGPPLTTAPLRATANTGRRS